MNRGSQSQILDCLQTFDKTSAPGHYEDPDVHDLFQSQSDLDKFVKSQLGERLLDENEEALETSINCQKWYLWLNASKMVQLQFYSEDGQAAQTVTITSANFDSEKPSFRDSSGNLYTVIDKPARLDICPTEDLSGLCLGPGAWYAANAAMQALFENWCEASLLHLLSNLDLHAITDCTLTIAVDPKKQSGHKYDLLLEGKTEGLEFQEHVRPDCEGVAELYRECLKLLVMLDSDTLLEDDAFLESLNDALKSLEQSSGLFNVGLENVFESLQKSSTPLNPRVLLSSGTRTVKPANTIPFVFMLGTHRVLLTSPIQIVYTMAQNLDGASAPKRAREKCAATVAPHVSTGEAPHAQRARKSTGMAAQRASSRLAQRQSPSSDTAAGAVCT